ncbi:MAG: meso-butanediol dehydrogenase / (S,S)-butanediol dehydrogenase / diacetyl reductase [Actinomycetota bacterium]|nr:meso-butanediol dehydrogenase / (S,S)-butanediol dehydrogenase / diacetyl reductase [Actinomycetota bacterium]
MEQLRGRVAVITGGGRGIGRALALRFASEGAAVVVSSRTAADLEAVLEQVTGGGGPKGLAVVADASDRDDARRPVTEAHDRFGRVDILVNNVGGSVGRLHDPFTGDDESFEGTLTLNLTSAWWTTRAALPIMRDQHHGRVINIGSGAAKRAAGSVGYTTAKHALVGLTRQLAVATAEHGITVNCLCPGWTNTSLLDFERVAARHGTTVEEAMAVAERDNAQHRVLEPEELTGMATLLVSDEGAGITGQVISVDGGYRL